MKQLTIEHLAPYFPHAVQMHFGKMMGFDLNYPVLAMHDNKILTYEEEGVNDIAIWMDLKKHLYHRLVLRPLSDLTKEITHRGETFVPIDRLIQEFTGGGDGMKLKFYQDGCYFYAYRNGVHCIIPQGKMINKLHYWMFDTQNLIGQNLAVDVNTLEFNPYEK